MAANDRIKDIATVRKWLREFSVFGDKTRSDFVGQSGYRHAYEKVEQFLDRFLYTGRDENNCVHAFFSLDVRDACHNPLFVFYKIHAFKDHDIRLHFTIINSLADGKYKTRGEIRQDIYNSDVYDLDNDEIDLTLYRKLDEYLKLGLLISKKTGKTLYYALSRDGLDLKPWAHAIPFFSEIDPLGVIGDYLRDRLDRMGGLPDYEPFIFRHHYIHHAVDAEIVETIAEAIRRKKFIEVVSCTQDDSANRSVNKEECIPIRFYHSVQSGRRYVVVYRQTHYRLAFKRIDRIQSVALGDDVPEYGQYERDATERLKYVWGVSDNGNRVLTHLEMTIRTESPNTYVLKRLELEKRHGSVERIDDFSSRFSIDVWDAHEMLPWVRTFIGYIVSLHCSNGSFVEQFKCDLRKAFSFYNQE